MCEIILGEVIYVTVKRYLRKNLLELAGDKCRTSCTNLFKISGLSHPWEQTLSLMSFIACNLERFQENSTVNRVTTQSMMIDQLPTFHVYREVHTVMQQSVTTIKSIINVDHKDKIHGWGCTQRFQVQILAQTQVTKIKILFVDFPSHSGY